MSTCRSCEALLGDKCSSTRAEPLSGPSRIYNYLPNRSLASPEMSALIHTSAAHTPAIVRATSADSDEALVASWIASLRSPHTRRNFGRTAERFLAALARPLAAATVEDVRMALEAISAGLAPSSARQQVLRVKSLLSYAHRLGYTRFNAGAVIRVHGDTRSLAKRIVSEVEVGLLIRAARSERDRVLLMTGYAAALRVSELVALTWGDVLARNDGKVQLSVLGKGEKRREILLPAKVGQSLLALRGEAAPGDPVFCSRKASPARTGKHPRALSPFAVNDLIKRCARRAGLSPRISSHWLRHAHASHAIERGETLPVVQATLGHSSVAITSVYLHACPGTSSALALDEGIFNPAGP
jgi:site-specific recombinase XerD